MRTFAESFLANLAKVTFGSLPIVVVGGATILPLATHNPWWFLLWLLELPIIAALTTVFP